MTASIEIGSGDPTRAALDVLAVCVEEGTLEKNPWVTDLERALGGGLVAHAKSVEFSGKVDQLLDVSTLGHAKARRILLVGAGPRARFDSARLRITGSKSETCAANFPGPYRRLIVAWTFRNCTATSKR